MTSNWGYSQENGPHKWAQIFPDAAGDRQSPVDIKENEVIPISHADRKLNWRYKLQSDKELINTGHGWQVTVGDKVSELTGGPLNDTYVLEQFHCHWGQNDDEGSEHTLNGKKFAGELHLVHWNSTKYKSLNEAAKQSDGLCVLGILLQIGDNSNKELQKIVSVLNKIEHKDGRTRLPEPVDLTLFFPSQSNYYKYEGSLTTPPFSQSVQWIIFKEPITVSRDQTAAFRKLKSYRSGEPKCNDDFQGQIKTNFRPPQPIGKRSIQEFPI